MAFNLKMQLKISKVAIYFMLVSLFAIAEETFIEIPISQTVSIGETAEFRCRHSTADIIRWRVNGSLVSISKHPVDITPGSVIEGDVSVSILTITGRPEYNGTEVFCVANFDDGTPEETTSSAAVLRVINNYTPTITTTKTTTIPDVQLTATELATTSGSTEPTLNPIGNFEITPSPLTVAVEQEVATFYCQCLSCDIITWLVNGTLVTKINSSNINITVTFIIRNMMYTLSIGTLLEYSGTTVECVAIFFHGSPPMHSPPVTLLIQDTPGEVENFTSERNSLSSLLTTRWSSLASLDLNDTDPDIVYSVELYKITCGEDIFMSHEDVFVNSTTNTVDPMEIYKVIITARNNVQGARNGTRVEIREVFMTLNKDKLFQLTRNSQFNTRDESPVPSYYTMILEPLDGHQEQNLMINSSVERSGEMVNISVDGEIPTKTLWNASLLAYGCQSDTVVKEVELSTHDIQNISVTSPQPGEVRVTGDFIDGSTATGLLIIIYSLTNDSNVHYIAGGSTSQQPRNVHVSVPGLAGGEYGISVFVVEENGLPFERVVTLPKLVAVETNDVVTPPSSSIEYSLQSTSTGVCITCTFLDTSATDCVAVVHQRISQLSSSGLMNIESSHKLNRSGNTASGCIEGVNMEDYQAGVVGGIRSVPVISRSQQGSKDFIAGSVFAVLFVLISVLSVIVPMVLICKTRGRRRIFHSRSSENSNIKPAINIYDECPKKELALVTSIDERHEVLPPPHNQAPPSPGISNKADHELDEPACTVPEPTYATPEVIKKPVSAPPLEVTVKYDTVEKFKNPQGQEYAMVVLPSSSGQTKPDDMHKATSEYSQILHGQHPNGEVTQIESNGEPEKRLSQSEVTPHALYTVENLLPTLHPICSKWKKLGMAMSMDDDYLDQVFTNNEGDEACLLDLLERYMDNGDFQHNWEEIVAILKKMDENALASDIFKLHVYPYVESQPKQTEDVFKDKLQSDIFETPPSPNSKVDENITNFDPSSPGPGENWNIQSTPAIFDGACVRIEIPETTVKKYYKENNNKPLEACQLQFDEDNKGHNSTIDDSGIFSMVNNTTLDLPAGPGMRSIAEN